MNRQVRGVGVGTVSLVMIFAVLCLTVFAMLTLSTSTGEKILSQKNAAFVKGYYEADTQATKIRAQILGSAVRGNIPDQIDGIVISTEEKDGKTYVSYACPINEVQEIYVQFTVGEVGNPILAWQARASGEWQIDDSLVVWDGEGFGE